MVEGEGRDSDRDKDLHYGRRGEERGNAGRVGAREGSGIGGEERKGGDAKLDPRERGGRNNRERGGETKERRGEGRERGWC
ncbi:hypothetical protein ACLOJK_000182 [Asimina triloba]